MCCKRKAIQYTYLFQALLILIIQFHRFLYSMLEIFYLFKKILEKPKNIHLKVSFKDILNKS